MKKKITYLIQLPPPVHGAAYLNKIIANSETINSNCIVKKIPINFSSELEHIGTISLKKIYKVFSLSVRLIKNILFFKPDYIYFTCNSIGLAFFRDVFFISLIKFFKIKLILHFHGKGISDKSKFCVYNFFYKFAFSNTNLIFTSYRLMEIEIKNLKLKGSCFYYAENGFFDYMIPPRKQKENFLVKLLFVSTLMPSKGIYILLYSASILKINFKNFHIDIVGGVMRKNEYPEIKKLINQLGLEEYVSLHGPIYGDKKHNFFMEADIFIFPTLHESFGLVILEAMQFGLPVISTIEGGIPDVVIHNKTGLLVEKNNPFELYSAISLLVSDKERRIKFGDAGKKRFSEKFTLEHFEKRLKIILNQIVS